MIKTIGEIECELNEVSGKITMVANDINGEDHWYYTITPPKFKNDMWTMVYDY